MVMCLWGFGTYGCLAIFLLDDGEEDPVGVQTHSPWQLAGTSAMLHWRPAARAHKPAGLSLLLRLKVYPTLPALDFPNTLEKEKNNFFKAGNSEKCVNSGTSWGTFGL